jgi:hypothetical protein
MVDHGRPPLFAELAKLIESPSQISTKRGNISISVSIFVSEDDHTTAGAAMASVCSRLARHSTAFATDDIHNADVSRPFSNDNTAPTYTADLFGKGRMVNAEPSDEKTHNDDDKLADRANITEHKQLSSQLINLAVLTGLVKSTSMTLPSVEKCALRI